MELVVKFTLLTEMLGTQPGDEQVFQTYIASKAPAGTEDESVNIDEMEQKGTTVFRRHPKTGELCIMDYHVKGALKSRGDSIRARLKNSINPEATNDLKATVEELKEKTKKQNMTGLSESEKAVLLKQLSDAKEELDRAKKLAKSDWGSIKGKLDDDLHVYPRFISLGRTKPDRINQRPLRAQTAQGQRVSLAASEEVDADISFEVKLILRDGRISREMLIEMLDELKFVGIGQWRNAGYGRCDYEIISENGVDKTKAKKAA